MTDEGTITRQSSTDGEPGVHRLRDIVVEEVSLVDRAANKRRFLIVKRSSEMADNGKPKGRREAGEDPTGEAARGGKKSKPSRPYAEVDKARPRAMRAESEDDEDETEKARRPQSARGEDDEEEDDDEVEVDADKAASDDEEDDEDEDEKEATKADKTRPRVKAGAGTSGGAAGSRQGRSSKPAEKAIVKGHHGGVRRRASNQMAIRCSRYRRYLSSFETQIRPMLHAAWTDLLTDI